MVSRKGRFSRGAEDAFSTGQCSLPIGKRLGLELPTANGGLMCVTTEELSGELQSLVRLSVRGRLLQ